MSWDHASDITIEVFNLLECKDKIEERISTKLDAYETMRSNARRREDLKAWWYLVCAILNAVRYCLNEEKTQENIDNYRKKLEYLLKEFDRNFTEDVTKFWTEQIVWEEIITKEYGFTGRKEFYNKLEAYQKRNNALQRISEVIEIEPER